MPESPVSDQQRERKEMEAMAGYRIPQNPATIARYVLRLEGSLDALGEQLSAIDLYRRMAELLPEKVEAA